MASVACCARRECMGQLKPQIGRRVVWPGMEKIHDPAARHRFRSHVPMSRIQNEARLPTPRSGTYSAASGAPAFVGLPLVASAGSAWPGRKWSKSRPSANMRGAGTPWPRGRHCSGTLPRPHRAAADRVRPPAGSGDKGLPFALRDDPPPSMQAYYRAAFRQERYSGSHMDACPNRFPISRTWTMVPGKDGHSTTFGQALPARSRSGSGRRIWLPFRALRPSTT